MFLLTSGRSGLYFCLSFFALSVFCFCFSRAQSSSRVLLSASILLQALSCGAATLFVGEGQSWVLFVLGLADALSMSLLMLAVVKGVDFDGLSFRVWWPVFAVVMACVVFERSDYRLVMVGAVVLIFNFNLIYFLVSDYGDTPVTHILFYIGGVYLSMVAMAFRLDSLLGVIDGGASAVGEFGLWFENLVWLAASVLVVSGFWRYCRQTGGRAIRKGDSGTRPAESYDRDRVIESAIDQSFRFNKYGVASSAVMVAFDFLPALDRGGQRDKKHVESLMLKCEKIIQEAVGSFGVVGRWDVDKYALVAPATKLEAALAMAEGMNSSFVDAFKEEGGVSAYFGVAEYQPEESIELWLYRADVTAHRAKQSGDRRVEAFVPKVKLPFKTMYAS